MRLHDQQLVLGSEYIHQLEGIASPETVASIQRDWKHADLTHQSGEKLLYVRVGQENATHDRPVLYVPGFTEGIVAKAPFAATMAELGFDFILPGQNRRKIVRDTLTKRHATYSQALNTLAIIDSEGLSEGPIDVITHSYGSLIFHAMKRINEDAGRKTFKNSRVILLAPAGTNEDEGLMSLGFRFAKHMIAENKTEKDFPDPNGEMLKAGTKNLIANLPRTFREMYELATARVDYSQLALGTESVTLLGYAEDKLFPHKVLASTINDAFRHGISYATPYSLQETGTGKLRGGMDASHNDEQFNPERVAKAIAQMLRSSS